MHRSINKKNNKKKMIQKKLLIIKMKALLFLEKRINDLY